MNIYTAPIRKTIAEMTASELIEKAIIIQTKSGDFYARVGDLDLQITEDDDMAVNEWGTCIGVMILSSVETTKLNALQQKIEALYVRQAAENYLNA